MNPNDYEATLADYLGGELSPAEAAAFEEHLAAHPERRAEVDELRATLAELDRLRAAPHDAPALSRSDALATPQRRVAPFLLGVGKAAAILIFGVLIGRWSAVDDEPQSPPDLANPNTAATPGTIHPGWYELADRFGSGHASFAALLGANASALR